MKHWQCPKVNGVLGHRGYQDVALREQVGAAVMVDHAFGVAGGAGGVVDGDGVPFVCRH